MLYLEHVSHERWVRCTGFDTFALLIYHPNQTPFGGMEAGGGGRRGVQHG